jgi:formylglycine-generating enzyme
MKRSVFVLASTVAILIGHMRALAGPAEWTTASGGNGHLYEVVSVPGGITWDDAKVEAFASGGFLATITSQAENDFVFGLTDAPSYWRTGISCGPWLGGFQSSSTSQPSTNWNWVTREPWSYTNWDTGQPNDSGGKAENKLQYWKTGTRASTWNDTVSNPTTSKPIAYVVESLPPRARVQWKVEDGGNDHFYQVVDVPRGITWDDAEAAAVAAGGYLATTTSIGENDFVVSLLGSDEWYGNIGPWLGGFQSPSTSQPDANWTWVTGEPWSYTNWNSGQPNDSSGWQEDKLHYYLGSPKWNDVMSTSPDGLPIAYIVESVPEPSTYAMLLAAGAIGLIGYWRRRKGAPKMTAMVLALFMSARVATADVFNMGGTQNADGTWNGLASVQFVTVGDPGNTADQATGNLYGAVPYNFQMGKCDVTLGQYCQFLNAVATVGDPYGLYNIHMANGWGQFTFGITQSGTLGSYTYTVTGAAGGCNINNMPANSISWGDAARFCNWLQNGQPSAPGTLEGTGTTETGAYSLNGATSQTGLMLITRNTGAAYVIPTENEWYKAAYYKGGGTNAGYWLYPTQSSTTPSNALSVTGTNNANFYDYYGTGNGGFTDPANYLTPVGAFTDSPSPYETYDMGGDVWQWNETAVTSSSRGLRGGSFNLYSNYLATSTRDDYDPTNEYFNEGFRVASVPEPGSISLLVAASFGVVSIAIHRRCRSS